MKEISLYRRDKWNQSVINNLVALVDDDRYEVINTFRWWAIKNRRTFYAATKINGVSIMMHHMIIGFPLCNLVTDHIDWNGLNNQENNIQHVTIRQNCQNHCKVGMKSKYVGVNKNNNTPNYSAKIRIGTTYKWLGSYKTEEEAYLAYQVAVENIGESLLLRKTF